MKNNLNNGNVVVALLGLFVLVAIVGVTAYSALYPTDLINKAAAVDCSTVNIGSCDTTQGCYSTTVSCSTYFKATNCPGPSCYVFSQSSIDNCVGINEDLCNYYSGQCTANYSKEYCTGQKSTYNTTCKALSYSDCNSYANSKKCKWSPVTYLGCTGTFSTKTCTQNPNYPPPKVCISCSTVLGPKDTIGCDLNRVVKFSSNGCNLSVLQDCNSTNTTCRPADFYHPQAYCQ